ncbi:MAG: gamma-glutamyltransferase [Acidobacteria bacterium]|nr:gamma-glutamyltransferase [Acidobacteriota bacterium]
MSTHPLPHGRTFDSAGRWLRPHPREERHRRHAKRNRVARRRRRDQGRRQRRGRCGRDRVRARRHASDRRQHRRRRLHGLPACQRRTGDVRLPREGAREGVAGLHLAWKEQGKLAWKRLVDPAVALARDGFIVSDNLARSLKSAQRTMQKYPASVASFTKNGAPYEAGETLKQPDLAKTLERISTQGPAGF